ncbi:recombination protein RecR [bacterium]|nr:recombination protein RecR [bacterium]
MFSKTIQKLINQFSNFPTVGQRTATRFVFYLIGEKKEKVAEFINSIKDLKTKIKICPLCFKPFEGEGKICPICSDPRRKKDIICVVEKEVDLEAIEKTKKFKGVYFILGGTLPNFGKEQQKEKITKRGAILIQRIKKEKNIKEIILALNPTIEGQRTSLWLQRKLKPYNLKITQLGRGLPVGGELEYADEETLSSALESRR